MDQSLRSILNHPHQLDYTIHSCSNCSSNYHPFNILEDSPTEPSSRWSGSGPPNPSSRSIDPNVLTDHHPHPHPQHHPHQHLDHHPSLDPHSNVVYPNQLPKKKDYIIIDLGKPVIARSITFGKFHRPHPCNVKLFRIWGSLAPGEGKGDFRALLLDSQQSNPIQISSSSSPSLSLSSSSSPLSNNRRFQSIFKLHPSPSSNLQSNPSSHSHPNNKLLQLNSNSLHPNDPSNHDPSKNLAHHPPFHSIRVRGERHRSGPRMELLAQGELKNDPVPEVVPLRWRNDQVAWFKSSDHHHHSSSDLEMLDGPLPSSNQTVIVPVRYIKIEPLSAAGSNYNCSIWYIAVKGHDQEHIIRPCLENYEKWRAAAALRLCLKHLRQAGHFEAFKALIKSAIDPSQSPVLAPPSSDSQFYSSSHSAAPSMKSLGTPQTFENSSSFNPARFHFEHSLISALHSALVPHPSYRPGLDGPLGLDSMSNSNGLSYRSSSMAHAEQIVIQAASEGLFDRWARAEPPTLACQQIHRHSILSSELPCPRGGHQMCIDAQRRKIWLFGGFDGFSDLGDLWVYHLEPLNPTSQEEGSSSGYMQNDHSRSKGALGAKMSIGSCDYAHVHSNRWQRISHDVKQDNGPMNRSCHKMVLDEITGDLYVLGRYTERSRTGNIKSLDSLESTANGHSSLHTERLSVQTGRISNTLVGSEHRSANPEVEPTDTQSDFTARIISDPSGLTRQAHTTAQTAEETQTTPQPEAETNVSTRNAAPTIEPPNTLPPSTTGPFKNDMFRFQPFKDPSSDELWMNNGRIGRWECLSQDTHAENGPKLIFDHQMVLDSERRKIYVFGGKIIQPIPISSQDPSGSSRIGSSQYSGLFEYDLTTQTWTQLMADSGSSGSASSNPQSSSPRLSIPSRMGHSLILDKKRQCLWVLTGERDHHYYSDIWKYDLINHRAQLIIADYTYGGKHRPSSEADTNPLGSAPEAGFSQRITFDPELDEWHMFCGLCRDRGSGEIATKANSKSEMMSSEFWRWRIDEGRWTKVVIKSQFDGMETPPPRFAHQMVFDSLTKTHYVFGGNPADNDNEPTRLGDFWKLKLIQPTRREALRRCLFALRRQHFIEMCEQGADTVGALLYLQNDLSSVTNHLDEREAKVFRACTTHLLAGPGPRMPLLEDDDELSDVGERIEEDEEEHCTQEIEQEVGKWEGQDHMIEFSDGKIVKKDDYNQVQPDGGDYLLSHNRQQQNDYDEHHHNHHHQLQHQRLRDQRTQLFQDLLKCFPPSMTEPEESLMDLIDVWGDRETFW